MWRESADVRVWRDPRATKWVLHFNLDSKYYLKDCFDLKKKKTLIVIRELLDLKESRVPKGIKAMLWVPWLDWINFSVAHSFLNTLLFRPWLCAVTLQGAPGKDGLDGVPGVDGAKVTFNSKHFCSRLQHLYTLIPKTAAWRVYIKEMYRS